MVFAGSFAHVIQVYIVRSGCSRCNLVCLGILQVWHGCTHDLLGMNLARLWILQVPVLLHVCCKIWYALQVVFAHVWTAGYFPM